MSRYVTFTLDEATYGIDVLRVQEALTARPRTRVPLAPTDVAGLVNLRGQVVLALDLRTRLGLPPRGEQEPMMIVVHVDGEPVSLLVDAVGDVVDAGPDSFEEPPATLDPALRALVRGAHKLEDRLLLVLDVDAAVAG
ncbi:MAG: chemotaxis protein CheW [Cellulomonas sp.]|jgi:purine-binding chemotaxis protein CheW|uniref:chemotaxis protein CheW n=1 Tax=Cellulomonas sp. TaxID=40001 RepID=UPI0019F00D6C|nr:chemotaxis protein CheW [Cellulomonas sp.]MBF0689166.1 chemotaxis protein CheW [Cellulomonas sp.]